MPTNAEIHAAIDLYITAQRSHILNNTVAQVFHDMVDNITAGQGGVPGIDDVLAVGQTLTENRTVNLNNNDVVFSHIYGEDPEQLLWLLPSGFSAKLMGTDGDARSHIQLIGDLATVVTVQIRSDDGTSNESEIVLNGRNSTAQYQAANGHEFASGDIKITALAGGGTTGLSIDNDGKIIRTP